MTDWVHHDLSKRRSPLLRTIVRREESRKLRERFDWAEIEGAVPQASEPTRDRIVRIKAETGKLAREVHATVRGEVTATGEGMRDTAGLRRFTYNPFRSAVFHDAETGEEWKGSRRVFVQSGYVYEIES